MEETYTPEVAERDAERSRALLAGLTPAGRVYATELMAISFRAGEAAGRRKMSNTLAGLL